MTAAAGKRVAILQSNYIPWKGYFDMIAAVDEFILYDDAQYTRSDWRNRNQVKTPQGVQWITVPVKIKGKLGQAIRETEIDGERWALAHWKTLAQNYGRAPCFREVAQVFEPLYLERRYSMLSDLNRTLIEAACAYLGIRTPITNSWDYTLAGDKTGRLAGLCRQAGAEHYVSGPAARDYLEEDVMAAAGVSVHWFDYAGYPEYPQPFPPFVHGVTILDLLFSCGRDSPRFMKHARP